VQKPWGPEHGRSMSEPLRLLVKIPIRECGEPVVRIETRNPRLIARCKFPYLRARLIGMLEHAARVLPDDLSLMVTAAYRPVAEQRQAYEHYFARVRAEHPDWPLAVVRRRMNRYLAPVDAKVPAPHCTGGTVDVRILLPDGQDLDMGSTPKGALDVARWDSPKISAAARANRQILWDAMTAAGFTNYRAEWWHWSFGDSGWAYRLGKPFAIYGLVDLQGLEAGVIPERPPRWKDRA